MKSLKSKVIALIGLLPVFSAANAYQTPGYQPYPVPGYMPYQVMPQGYPHPGNQPRYLPRWNPYPPRYGHRVKPVVPAKPSVPVKKLLVPVPATTTLSALPKMDKKDQVRKVFIELLVPMIEKENKRLYELKQEMVIVLGQLDRGTEIGEQRKKQLKSLSKQYRVKGKILSDPKAREELRQRIDIVPVSLTLAQAANESAWGTSRFAQQGKNLFGIWTYDESNGLIPKGRKAGEKHLVRKFKTLDESVSYYMHTLNSHPAYVEFRAIRWQQRLQKLSLDGGSLAKGLTKYSAKGEEYVRLIQALIRNHNFAALDLKNNQA